MQGTARHKKLCFTAIYLRQMARKIVLYGVALALLTLSLQLLEYKLVIINHSLEVYITLISLFFTVVGVYVGRKLNSRKHIVVEKLAVAPVQENEAVPTTPASEDWTLNGAALDKLGLRLLRGLRLDQAEPVGNPVHMSVHGDRGLLEAIDEDAVGGLPSHGWQRQEGFHV